MTTGNGRKPRRHGVKRKRTWKNPFFSKPGAVSSVLDAVLRGIGFSASRCSFLRSRRQISSRIRLGREFRPNRGAMRNSCRQFAPNCANYAPKSGACFGRNSGPNFNRRDFPENLCSISLEVVGCFLCILLYRFLQRRPSIKFSASSFLRFSENSFCRKPTRARILRRIVAVVLSVSLLATQTPVLHRSNCVGHATAKPREHGIPEIVHTALKRREHGGALDAFPNYLD